MIADMDVMEDENRRPKKLFAELTVQNKLLKEALGRITRPAKRRELAAAAVTQRGVSMPLGIEVDFSLPAKRVTRTLDRIIEWRGTPLAIRVDNGPECISGQLLE